MSSEHQRAAQAEGGSRHSGGTDSTERPTCFVIMPVSDPPEYAEGHFERVFRDLFEPACSEAGYKAIRANDVRETNLIHSDILEKLLDSPMALCDLSSRNPNVLFELGLRQAFDKPVTLVREVGTLDIFDIALLRYQEYRSERIYHEVLEDQQNIAGAIRATKQAFESGQGLNSIVKLLALTRAALPDVQEVDRDPLLQLVRAEMGDLRTELREALNLARSQGAQQPSPIRRVSKSDYRTTLVDISNLKHQLQHLKKELKAIEVGGVMDETLEHRIRAARVGIDSAYLRAKEDVSLSQQIAPVQRDMDEAEVLYHFLQDRA